jgi:integrase
MLAEWVAEVAESRVVGPQHTYAELTDEWLKLGSLEAQTVHGYKGYLRRYLLPEFGTLKVSDITPHRLDVFYKGMIDQGFSARTVRQAHAILRSSLAKAVAWGWIGVNPAAQTRPGLKDAMAPDVDAPTVEEFRTLRAYLDETNPLLSLLVVVAASIGTRKGEAMALRYNDVDFEAGTISVDKSVYQITGESPHLKGTKTGATGTIAVSWDVIDLIKHARTRADKQARNLGLDFPDDAFIFTDDPAGRCTWLPSTVTQQISKARAICHLPARVTMKNLRHFHATQLLANGEDLATVAHRLRHTQKSTTLNFYAKKDAVADRRAADRMGGLL